MRIQGTFLRSAVARRIFWALLAAALLPLALFAALGGPGLIDHLEARERRIQLDRIKEVAMRVHERLSSARVVLAVHAEWADWNAPDARAEGPRRVFRGLTTVGADGGFVAGDAMLAQVWRDRAPEAPGQREPRRLWWWQEDEPGDRSARLMMAKLDHRGRGWWLAEVDPRFVWADFVDNGLADSMCVRADGDVAIHCPDGGDAADGDRVQWPLFMAGAFGSPDWRFQGAPNSSRALFGNWEIAPMVLKGLVATLLLIATLGLVLVRRTMQPLDALAATTRRLAGRDWTARVKLDRRDEFGALAASFNTMAERIGHQVQALEVQSAIDRRILGKIDVDGMLGLVVARMQALVPGARAGALSWTNASGRSRAHGPAASRDLAFAPATIAALVGPSRTPAPATVVDPVPPWIGEVLSLDPEVEYTVWALGVDWQDRRIAMLLLAAPRAQVPDAEVWREIDDLRGRVAVGVAAAARERLLVERATRDPLTGLLNRHGLHEAGTPGEGGEWSLLFVDLDAFKDVNDTAGHAVGDELLRAVTSRLSALVPAGTAMARPGGDEFVIYLPGPSAAAGALAQRLCETLAQRFDVAGHELFIGATVGIALSPAHGRTHDELMRKADLAMYAAKAAGRGQWRIYEAAMDERAAERAWITRDLRAAIGTPQLLLHFQPRVDPGTGEVRSTEALLRWQHPVRGAIGPMRFIPVAEDTGLIESLGRSVLHMALHQLSLWRACGVPCGRIAVNVSARQLHDPGFVDAVLAMLAEHGLTPQDLEIEITESLFLGAAATATDQLARLRACGVAVALDDFGTGYSSLSALHRLPVDVLKIDRAFVIELGDRESADAVARSIVVLARALGKRVVAEGVETPRQLAQLRALGVDEIQGYLYARPLPAPEFADRLAEGFEREPAEAL